MKKAKYNLFFILDFLYILLISLVFYFTMTLKSERIIYIPSGSVSSSISYLSSKYYELNSLDSILIRFLGSPQQGWIDLKDNHMSKYDFLYKLTTSKAALKTITLIPGETFYFFLRQISKKLNLSIEKLSIAYDNYKYKLDGNILAESYNIPLGMDEDKIVNYLIDYTNTKYREYSKKLFNQYDKNKWYKYITIASIIQKEAANVREMSIVSSVIYNRLKINMRLQMDGTLNYGKYSHVAVTAKRIREDKTNYNTYKINGLPSNPICAVGFDAIKAAIKPSKTNYLYFVKSEGKNEHHFSSTHKKHVSNIRKNRINKKRKTSNKKKSFKKKQKNLKQIWRNVK